TFEHVVDNIKAFLSADSDGALLEQRLAADAELEQAVRAALEESLSADTRDTQLRMLDELGQMRTRPLRMHPRQAAAVVQPYQERPRSLANIGSIRAGAPPRSSSARTLSRTRRSHAPSISPSTRPGTRNMWRRER